MNIADIFKKVKGIINFTQANELDIAKIIKYLKFFGYLKTTLDDGFSLDDIVDAIRKFQEMFGIPQDGQISLSLLNAMSMPRCGFPDVHTISVEHAEMLTKWTKNGVLYYVDKLVSGIPQNRQLEIIQTGFDVWSNVANIKANRTTSSSQADIIIGTGSSRADQFDGPSGTLAWSYLPDGQNSRILMKYDASENWVDGPTRNGIDMQTVTNHEFGHSLGLTHSKVQGALMAPFYNASVNIPQTNDDIPRMQSLYGKPTSIEPPTSGDDVIITLPPGTTIKGITGYRLFKL